MGNNKYSNNQKVIGRINRRSVLSNNQEPQDWWKMSRRKFIIGSAIGIAGIAGLGLWIASEHDDTQDINHDSLELQRKHGWDIGSESKKLSFPNVQAADSQKNENWKRYLDTKPLLEAYQPKNNTWLPYFVPTLIQSLQFESLRSQLVPILTSDMDENYQRGQSIARDFLSNSKNANETALIVDLPGRDSIALGAGMSEAAHLVTTFDNFPHPLGVTPSHETLAAMLYYANEIESKQSKITPTAPPVFLLDSNRLEHYTDENTQFDNRYLAKLPSAQKFKENGIKSLLYITPDRTHTEELDDLNEDFVEYKGSGLNVAMLPADDFKMAEELVEKRKADGSTEKTIERHYYYGGNPASHILFFHAYPFFLPSPIYINRYPSYINIPPSAPRISPPRYTPAPRPTMFAGTRIGGNNAGGIGRTKPSGFGRSTVRMSTSGSVIGTRAGRSGYYSGSRSGSFGRGVFFGG